jgi:calcineurin-like phosphoesterase family protein
MSFCPYSRALANNDITTMNQLLIDGINSRCTKEDTLYILGDVSFTTKPKEIAEFIMSLNVGEMHLILGNHDHIIRNDRTLQKYFDTVHDYKKIKIENDNIVLMHYPIESWDGMHHKPNGSYHLHGHTHARNDHLNTDFHRGELSYKSRRFDVGIDSRTDFKPWKWEEIKDFINVRESSKSFVDMMNQGV